MSDARGGNWARAARELARRAGGGGLHGPAAAAAVALDEFRQGSKSGDWPRVLENLRAAGRLSDADWHAYAEAAVWVGLRMPSIGAGDSPRFEVRLNPTPVRGVARIAGTWAVRSFAVDGRPIAGVSMSGTFDYQAGRGGSSSSASGVRHPLAAGDHAVEVVVDVDRTAVVRPGVPAASSDVWRQTVTLSRRINVADSPPAASTLPAGRRPAVTVRRRKAATVSRIPERPSSLPGPADAARR